MTRKIIYLMLCLALLINSVSAAPVATPANSMTLDSMTGGMSTDTKGFLIDLMYWVIGIGLIVCVIIAAAGFWTTNPTWTKWGVKGIVAMVIVVLLYYAANFGIAFLQANYG